jgi:DNA-binding transcriptional regulator YiaG
VPSFPTSLRTLIAAQHRFSPAAVRRHRDRLGLTASHYAALLGVSARVVYNWEADLSRPTPDQVLRWVEVLDSDDEVVLQQLGLDPVTPMTPREIRAKRRRLGLSQARYGVLLGLDQGMVSRWEAGTRKPSRDSLRRIEAAGELDPEEAERRVERGPPVRVKTERVRRPRMPKAERRYWPRDPETELARLEAEIDEQRELDALREQFSPEAVREHRQALGLSARAPTESYSASPRRPSTGGSAAGSSRGRRR